MRNLLKSRKAQFYILSVVAIIGILYFLSRWMEPGTITDTSSVVLMNEPFIFNNIKEKAVQVVKSSKDCEELGFNLGEYKSYVESYSSEETYALDFNYTYASCPGTVDFKMKLTSPSADIASNFSVTWP